MKIFTNKKIVQKVIIAIVIVLSFNFVAPTYSQADFGGVLFGPIVDFVAKLFDAILAGLQYFMYDGATNTGGTIGGVIGDITDGVIIEGGETVGEIVGGSVGGAITFVNPFDTFLVDVDDFDANKYGMSADGEDVDYKIKEDDLDQGWFGLGTYQIPIIKYSADKIFSNKIPALDVNFINPTDWKDEEMNSRSITLALHSTIANWYIALRNLAIVALLSVLLYVGIRMVISSTAADKAKYKQMIIDWLVALCIVFFLHYIMSFILTITGMITDGIDTSSEIVVEIDKGNDDLKFKTDLTGWVRMQVQHKDLGVRMIYLIFYIALVIYTVMFTWTYVKRAITMAFLTLMAPLVAITYPIDKFGDGKAQAFGMWLKEFIFNALLQPFHLIIYTIFLGSSMEIAVQNPIYAILFLAFIIPAEKTLRKMFGFEKATTAGAMGAAAGMFGGAAAFNVVSGVLGKGNKSSRGQGTKDKIRTRNPVKDKNEIGKDFSSFATRANNSVNQNEESKNSIGANSNGTIPNLSDEENQELDFLRGELDNADYNDMYLNPEVYQEKQERLAELERKQAQSQRQTHNKNQNQAPSQAQVYGNTSGYEGIRRTNDSSVGAFNNEIAGNSDNLGELGNSNMPKSIIRGVKNVGTRAAKYTGKKLKHRFASPEGWKENAKFAGRMAVRGASAAAFGAIGVGMGIAGGDLEDVLKFGAAGATLGGTVVGERLADAGGKVMHNANMAFQEGYYGDKNAALMAQQHREYFNDEEKREFFGEEFEVEGKELDNIMHRAADINNQGITDNKAVKQTIKLEDSIMKEMKADKKLDMSDEEKAKAAHEQALTIAKVADYYNTEKLRTNKDYRKGVYDDFERGLKKVNPEMSQKDLDIQKENMMKLLKKYKKID